LRVAWGAGLPDAAWPAALAYQTSRGLGRWPTGCRGA